MAAGPAGKGALGRTAAVAGNQTRAQSMTIRAPCRLDRGRGQISPGQKQDRPGKHGQDQETKSSGPFHNYFMISSASLKGKRSIIRVVSQFEIR
jgi:hypothetical protein